MPAVAVARPPPGAGEAQPRQPQPAARRGRVGLHRRRVRVGGVDDQVDPLVPEPGDQPGHAAEAADPDLARRQPRVADPAGEGADQRQVRAAGEPGGQLPRLRRAPEQEQLHRRGRRSR